MCVIIYKPAGEKLPDIDVLRAAAKANPHGFGFVSTSHFYRTLNADRFIERLLAEDEAEPMILHFRLATHGSIRRANCHPFKHGDVFMAHNGILDIVPNGDKTDSQTALDKLIYPAIKRYGINSSYTRGIIHNLIGSYSRIAILYNDEVHLYGQFYRRKGDKCLYSNLRFEHYLQPRHIFSLNHL